MADPADLLGKIVSDDFSRRRLQGVGRPAALSEMTMSECNVFDRMDVIHRHGLKSILHVLGTRRQRFGVAILAYTDMMTKPYNHCPV